MENRIERAVGEIVPLEHRGDGPAETRKEWLAPELRKVAIAEITAHNIAFVNDGMGTS
jgi:hypothetical protein